MLCHDNHLMTLLDLYHEKIRAHGFTEDPAQLAVLHEMQRIADDLARGADASPREAAANGKIAGLLAKWFTNTAMPAPVWIKGLYCWGGVGRGKTFLMDLFIEYLPTTRKRRRHFHRFMLEINAALNALGHRQNPIDEVVRRMGEEIDILCLDEFFVSDITHAMLLDRLLRAMHNTGITLVTTSNIVPDDLYKDGLQRVRFLPAIAWIEENLVVCRIDGEEDFRRHHLRMEDVFRTPDNEIAREALRADLLALSTHRGTHHHTERTFRAGSRDIPILWRNAGSLIFEFQVLCQGNYSQKDYIEIATRFAYVGIVGVPVMDEFLENAARRFLLLIDTFYDRRVKLLLTTATTVQRLYTGSAMCFEFKRLYSRLFEMQSETYWGEAHLNG